MSGAKGNKKFDMTYLNVSFIKGNDGVEIEVENDGVEGFISYNKEEKKYVPELAFGTFMASSNFDDS